ncbi:MAG: BLUF domain-containing protein [Sphingobacteriaceae bacterium]|nr:MAG: BLUF domain-containing protein [Sphingobacteriaceae bacterium]
MQFIVLFTLSLGWIRLTQSLHQIAYCSVSVYHHTDAAIISDILVEARAFNQKNDITGILLYKEDSYFQILEAETQILERVIFKISKDPRHKRMMILYNVEINQRDFASWVMAFRAPMFTPALIARMQDNDFGSYINDPTQLTHQVSRNAQVMLTVFEENM